MKTNELMVGNYLTFKDCLQDEEKVLIKVEQINQDGTILASIDGNDSLDCIGIDEDTVGIPITDEILEKNGFKNIKERIDGECDSFSNLFELNEDVVLGKHEDLYEVCCEKWNGDWDVYDHHTVFAIRHLHQLQIVLNIMGFEKEIDL
jgi:hypothetical protein